MAKILKEFTVITGTYTNKEGQQKNRYQRIGSLIETKNGLVGKIDVIPVKEGGWDGWFYINDPLPEKGTGLTTSRQNSGFDDMDNDLPDF